VLQNLKEKAKRHTPDVIQKKDVKEQPNDPDEILNARSSANKEFPENARLVFLSVVCVIGALLCGMVIQAMDLAYLTTRLCQFCFLLVVAVPPPVYVYVAYYRKPEQIAPPVQDEQTDSSSLTINNTIVNAIGIALIVSWFVLTWTVFSTPSKDLFDMSIYSILKGFLLWIAWGLVCVVWVFWQMSSIVTKIVKKCARWLYFALSVVAVALVLWYIFGIASDKLASHAEEISTEKRIRAKAWQETRQDLKSINELLSKNCKGDTLTLAELEQRVPECTTNFQAVMLKMQTILETEHIQHALAGQPAFYKANAYFENELILLRLVFASVRSSISKQQPVNDLEECFDETLTVATMQSCVQQRFPRFLTTVVKSNAITTSASVLKYVADHRCLNVAYTIFESGNKLRACEEMKALTKQQFTTLSQKYGLAQDACAAGLSEMNKNWWVEHLETFRQRRITMINWRTQCFAPGQLPSPEDVSETLQVDVLNSKCDLPSGVNEKIVIATNTTTIGNEVHKLYCQAVQLVRGYKSWDEITMRSVLKEIEALQSNVTDVVRDHVQSLREKTIKESRQTRTGLKHDIENTKDASNTHNNATNCMQRPYVCTSDILAALVKEYFARDDNSAHCTTPAAA
jgi:hypothetical protein